MARQINKLTAFKVNNLKKRGKYSDGDGLWLVVTASGSKNWQFRYAIDSKEHWLGLGSVNTYSLKEARERARRERQLLADGKDPLVEKRKREEALKAARVGGITFAEATRQYFETIRNEFSSERYARQWLASVETHTFPIIGDLDVSDIALPHVLKVLQPIWASKTKTARDLRGRIERILAWSIVSKHRDAPNPAVWTGNLSAVLAAPAKIAEVEKMAALHYAQVPALWEQLSGSQAVGARALQFAILTAARNGEIVKAEWSDIDLDERIWVVPKENAKMRREHRVPLSDAAVDLLRSLPRFENIPYVFVGGGRGGKLADDGMLRTLRGTHGGEDVSVHGMRSAFRTWCAERTNVPREIAEEALAHKLLDPVEAAYLRSDHLQKRVNLMQMWADFVMGGVFEGEVIDLTPLRKERA